MTLAYLTDGDGLAVPLEDIPDNVIEALARRGVDLVEGFLPAGDGENLARVAFMIDPKAESSRIEEAFARLALARSVTVSGTLESPVPDWLLDREVYARKPLSERDRAFLYGDGSGKPLGILDASATYQEPTESTSRQRRRWLARKGKK